MEWEEEWLNKWMDGWMSVIRIRGGNSNSLSYVFPSISVGRDSFLVDGIVAKTNTIPVEEYRNVYWIMLSEFSLFKVSGGGYINSTRVVTQYVGLLCSGEREREQPLDSLARCPKEGRADGWMVIDDDLRMCNCPPVLFACWVLCPGYKLFD